MSLSISNVKRIVRGVLFNPKIISGLKDITQTAANKIEIDKKYGCLKGRKPNVFYL